MELIDRRKLVSDFWKGVEDASILSYEDTDDLMENAPTVDAVEVVRCKDCKWFDQNEDVMPQSGSCAYHEMVKMDWDYCSRAKKGW